jgi:hypothetical protein
VPVPKFRAIGILHLVRHGLGNCLLRRWGYWRLIICGLPKELPKARENQAKLHSFFPHHRPEDDNYAHCEIWTFKEGEHVAKPKLPETVKKEFRQIMSDMSRIILIPTV